MYQAEKTFHYVKIVALFLGVIPEILSTISPFIHFLNEKQQKRLFTWRKIRNVFCQKTFAPVYGFTEYFSKIVPFIF